MRTLLTLAAALAGAITATAAPAQTLTYAVDPAHTRVHWEVRHFGTSTQRGRFGQVEAYIALDREEHRGELSVTIATGVVDSGVGPLDAMLRGSSFLAAEQFPQAYFVANALQFDGDRLTSARGEFTLRGVSRPLTLHALRFDCRREEAREVCGGDFEATFKRSDFGISFGLPFVGDEVRLVVQVEAARPLPA
ncbi:MAG: YceI family protein [Piscinibacter sp.]|nr:YceI family protein [Piscinibacter sp.]